MSPAGSPASKKRAGAWPNGPLRTSAIASDEVRQVLTLVDEVLSDLRAARGDTNFDLNLVAWAVPPPAPQPLPPPTLREAVSQVLRLSQMTPSPVERVSLLRTASTVLDQQRRVAPEPWVSDAHEPFGGSSSRNSTSTSATPACSRAS